MLPRKGSESEFEERLWRANARSAREALFDEYSNVLNSASSTFLDRDESVALGHNYRDALNDLPETKVESLQVVVRTFQTECAPSIKATSHVVLYHTTWNETGAIDVSLTVLFAHIVEFHRMASYLDFCFVDRAMTIGFSFEVEEYYSSVRFWCDCHTK